MKHGSPMYEVKGGEVCSDLGSSTERAIRGSHVSMECQAREEDISSRGLFKGICSYFCLLNSDMLTWEFQRTKFLSLLLLLLLIGN